MRSSHAYRCVRGAVCFGSRSIWIFNRFRGEQRSELTWENKQRCAVEVEPIEKSGRDTLLSKLKIYLLNADSKGDGSWRNSDSFFFLASKRNRCLKGGNYQTTQFQWHKKNLKINRLFCYKTKCTHHKANLRRRTNVISTNVTIPGNDVQSYLFTKTFELFLHIFKRMPGLQKYFHILSFFNKTFETWLLKYLHIFSFSHELFHT